MENEKRYGGAIVVPEDVEMHSPVDIVDIVVDELQKRKQDGERKDND